MVPALLMRILRRPALRCYLHIPLCISFFQKMQMSFGFLLIPAYVFFETPDLKETIILFRYTLQRIIGFALKISSIRGK